MAIAEATLVPQTYVEADLALDNAECSLKHFGRDGGKECNFVDMGHQALRLIDRVKDDVALTYPEALEFVTFRHKSRLCITCPALQWALASQNEEMEI